MREDIFQFSDSFTDKIEINNPKNISISKNEIYKLVKNDIISLKNNQHYDKIYVDILTSEFISIAIYKGEDKVGDFNHKI